MSNESESHGTKPVAEHAWLQHFVGNWKTVSEMTTPEGEQMTSHGTESVTSFGGLWALAEGSGEMPGGDVMHYKVGLGYDVSFKEYRGFWIADVSSHLWKYVGTLSEDGRVMTLECEGPSMTVDGETALYRDVHELVDENTRTMTSYGQGESGNWHQFMKVTYTRV